MLNLLHKNLFWESWIRARYKLLVKEQIGKSAITIKVVMGSAILNSKEGPKINLLELHSEEWAINKWINQWVRFLQIIALNKSQASDRSQAALSVKYQAWALKLEKAMRLDNNPLNSKNLNKISLVFNSRWQKNRNKILLAKYPVLWSQEIFRCGW